MQKVLALIIILNVSVLACMSQVNTDRLIDMGRNALYFEDYIVSIQLFNQAIKARPYLTEPYIYRAYAKLNLDDFRGAIEDCDKALEINPFLPQVYYCRGYAYRRIGRMEQSTDDFRRAIDIEPANLNATYMLVENLIRMEKHSEAITVCDSSLAIVPGKSDTYLLRSEAFLAAGDTTSAINDIGDAIRSNRHNDMAYAVRGMLYMELKDYTNAIADLDEAIFLNSYRADYWGNRAIIKMRCNDLRGAMSDLNTAIGIDNRNSSLYFNRGIFRAQVGENNLALEDMTVCLALDPSNHTARLQKAYLETETGAYRDAIDDFTAVIERYPDFPPAYMGRADAKRKVRDMQGAEKDRYLAMVIEDEIRSGKRQPRKGNDGKPAPSAKAEAIVQKLNKEKKEKYSSEIRGQVQYKEVDIEPMRNFEIASADSALEKERRVLFNQNLSDYTRSTGRKLRFCIHPDMDSTASYKRLNEPLDEAFCEQHPSSSLVYFCRANNRLREATSLSQTYAPLSEYTLCISDFMMAYQMDPTLIYALYNVAYVYILEKSFNKAIEIYNQVIERYPDFAEAYYNRGLLHIYQGDTDLGRTDLSKAGELGLHQAYNVIRRYAK